MQRNLVVAALGAALAVAAPAAAQEGPAAAGPELTRTTLHDRALTIRVACRTGAVASVTADGRRLARAPLACRAGRGHVRVTLPAAVARRAGAPGGLRLALALTDARGTRTERVELSRPMPGRTAHATLNRFWPSAAAFCAYIGTTRRHEVYVNNDTFGFPYNKWIWVRAVFRVYIPSLNTYATAATAWSQHEAGFSSYFIPGVGWTESPKWPLNVPWARVYSQASIQVYGGDTNWVRLSTAFPSTYPNWCYWAT